MWTWPVYDSRPSETNGRDEDDDEPLLRIHQPAPIEAREQRPSAPQRPETSVSQRPETSRQRRPETSSRQRRHDITPRDEQEFPTQDHGAEHLGQDDGKKHRRGVLPIGAPGRSSAHTVAGKSKPLESSTARSTSRSGRAASGTVAASAALRQLGTPYVWGGGSGAGATGGGFDCSGLALYAWARAGVSLPHYTGTQFTKGTKIPFSQLRPGDLVFFGGGSGDPTHVGIYLKNGVMIHAPKSGDVVRKVDFAHSPYYRARYRGAIRPSN
ncbi:C40 family peptidase [Sphaerisporangium viridialbum]|uniref:C40 family peptidase n=1 Tax=Sphaerisporangium viridialbum TaxID=46189 RepID=UPI003C70B78D